MNALTYIAIGFTAAAVAGALYLLGLATAAAAVLIWAGLSLLFTVVVAFLAI